MDKKQLTILKRICDDNAIPFLKIRFKQFRNLKEFKHFNLEYINPTHKIKIKGSLKNKYIHDGNKNKIINVGEILMFVSATLFIKDVYTVLFWFNSILLTIYFYHLCILQNPLEVFKYYFNWYRRRFGNRKNINCC